MGDLQDGMLSYYLEQAKASDVNVEKLLDSQPFDYRDYLIRYDPCQIFPALSIIEPSPFIEKQPSSESEK
jgi:hypothetical protein